MKKKMTQEEFSAYLDAPAEEEVVIKEKTLYGDIIKKASETHNVDSDIVKAIINVESSGNATAVSPKGAGGAMQLMPGTAKELGVTDINDPEQNIMAGARYYRQMLDRYGGNETLALAAYNAGPKTVDVHGGVPNYPETQNYVKKVLDKRNQYKKEEQPIKPKMTQEEFSAYLDEPEVEKDTPQLRAQSARELEELKQREEKGSLVADPFMSPEMLLLGPGAAAQTARTVGKLAKKAPGYLAAKWGKKTKAGGILKETLDAEKAMDINLTQIKGIRENIEELKEAGTKSMQSITELADLKKHLKERREIGLRIFKKNLLDFAKKGKGLDRDKVDEYMKIHGSKLKEVYKDDEKYIRNINRIEEAILEDKSKIGKAATEISPLAKIVSLGGIGYVSPEAAVGVGAGFVGKFIYSYLRKKSKQKLQDFIMMGRLDPEYAKALIALADANNKVAAKAAISNAEKLFNKMVVGGITESIIAPSIKEKRKQKSEELKEKLKRAVK